ncbi:DUF3386 domain-containing protein [Kovacikia minuta CCNUW1]|uniref:DUF3386 domain-containing protein n=1 Tax=Kovacikia minuta TaxID=2931930 RepID=UPI001CCA4FCD|nr:DUF3386 domain-containing protein [Kovacikia minuta]UBF24889.1 DUF3386 domain-containing protein [Kovacikia minuta CCNUW1]
MTEQLSARNLFRAAYENRYTWDKNFPGYTADVQLRQGDQVYTGKIQINSDLSFDVTDVADEAAKKAIHSQVWEIAVHRVRRPFEETHGKNTFELGETDPTGAVEILVGGKAEGDRYKVRNNEVCLVHRFIHGVFVTINTFSTIDTGEGYLSHRYDSIYHDAKTGEQKGGIQDFEDTYEKIGHYWIMTRRDIHSEEDGQPATTEFAFSNVKLLQPVAV